MLAFARFVLKQRKHIIWLTVLLCIVSLCGMLYVQVNYDISSYLPPSAPTSQALKVIGDDAPNMKVFLPSVSIQQAREAKQKLLACPHVNGVLWLDDVVDLRATPEETLPEDTLSAWYRGGGALFQVTVDPEHYVAGFNEIRTLYPDCLTAGNAANQARMISVSMKEIGAIIPFVLPIVLLILLISTRHYFEPVLFLLAIGVAILLNEGSNYFLGSVSFVTRSSAAVLQLAVSIDYAVFLLHRFAECREQGMDNETAMAEAMVRSASSVAASAMTTVFGFLALMLMGFRLGSDMGRVLAKGVLVSYLTVMFFLPAAAVSMTKWIDKTAHRSFMPSFRRTSRAIVRHGAPLALILLMLLLPAYLGQKNNNFLYGSSGMHAESSPVKIEAKKIDQLFGRSQQLLLMVPEGDLARVNALSQDLQALPEVTAVVSYPKMVGLGIPPDIVPKEQLKQLRSNGFDRIILYADVAEEGESAFRLVQAIRSLAVQYYGDGCLLAGECAANLDIKDCILGDSAKVLWGGILSIGLILLMTFRSLSIPVVLLVVIEGAIWINLSLPYFQGITMNYIGYQIVASVQLGATVDYGILLTQRYMEARQSMDKKDAAEHALLISIGSILPPALILTAAGLLLGFISTNGVISQMGLVLGRGAAISAGMVLVVLPHVLMFADKLISKTTLRPKEAGKNMKKTVAALLLCLMMALPFGGALAVQKTEVVYASLDNMGQMKGLYIINEFEADKEETALDYGAYDKVENLSGLDPIVYDGEKAELTLLKGRFRYQGNPKDMSIPWDISLSYTLDGQEVPPESLSGANGKVSIRLSVTPKDGKEKLTSLITLQIALTLDSDRCLAIDAPGATMAAAGGNRTLSYVVLPGIAADYTVTMQAEGFYLPAVSIAGVQMVMDGAMYKQYTEKKLAGSPLAAAAGNMMDNMFGRPEAQPESFADARNGSIERLQFIMMTEGIPDSPAEKKSAEEADAAEESLFARLQRLFTN